MQALMKVSKKRADLVFAINISDSKAHPKGYLQNEPCCLYAHKPVSILHTVHPFNINTCVTVYCVSIRGPGSTSHYQALHLVLSLKLKSKIGSAATIPSRASHNAALVPACWFTGVLRFLHFSNHLLKGLGDILVQSRTCFSKGALELFGQLASLICGHLPLFGFEVTLVAYDDEWDPVCALGHRSACGWKAGY